MVPVKARVEFPFKNIAILITVTRSDVQITAMADEEPLLNITTEAFSGRSRTKPKLDRRDRVSKLDNLLGAVCTDCSIVACDVDNSITVSCVSNYQLLTMTCG